MKKNRTVITGLGVISSNGTGKSEFFSAISKGISGVKPISLFDTAGYKAKTAAEIRDFQPQQFLGSKGLRTLDRSTKLVNSAAKLALDDAGVVISEDNTHSIGVAVGSTLGSVYSISEFDKDALKEGPQYVNPALFPNTVINSPASQVSIKFNIKGLNATISTGFSASLDAVKYAVDFLREGRVKMVLAAGVEELCVQTFLGFYKTGFLAGTKDGSPEICCPFDKRRNGIILGEAGCVVIIEDLESALGRGAHIYAEVSGYGRGFDGYRINKYNPKGRGLRAAMGSALESAGLDAGGIDYISSAANSTVEADAIESGAIKDIFGARKSEPLVSSIKSMTGECFSASGALQIASACGSIQDNIVPPTINYIEKDPACDLNYVVNDARGTAVNNVLINAFGPSGCNASLVISRFKA